MTISEELKHGSPTFGFGLWRQLEVRHHFPFDLLKKNIKGYVDDGSAIWLLYEEAGRWIRVPFARNRKWFEAMVSEPEMVAFRELPQIYVV